MTKILFFFAACMLFAGCAGPNPVMFKVSLLSVYAPRINVATQPASDTNHVASAVTSRGQADANTQTIQPSQRGVCILLDNLFAFPVGSGSAASNEVPVSFSFNKE